PGRVYSLDHFKAFMKRMGDPQFGLSCIHIGGTNGKGSTTNYIKSVLMKAGYKVGMFTSPAMVSRTEIIRVDDIAISEEWMVYYASRYLDDWLDARLSMFEIEMFIAVMYYLQHGVDVALFEVGLGGALDATNIIHPLLAVNTNIGLDHIDYLGDSYESIAENKAGIIKDGVDFMTGETREICLAVFRRIAMSHHSRVITIDPVDHYTVDEGISYHYHGHDVFLATDAVYQVDNSALAINVLEYIRPVFPFTEEHLIEGLKHAFWAGRYEVLSTKPLIVIDGAHNKEGMEALARSAKTLHHPHIIFTALRDKDTTHMLEILL
ncbi:MAG: bifunctional folylpolyglutamate synthase/dihydrofolate synthase, partial [bacterium]